LILEPRCPAVLVLVRRVAEEQRTVLPGLRDGVIPAAAVSAGQPR
jgi:hypothetical protein